MQRHLTQARTFVSLKVYGQDRAQFKGVYMLKGCVGKRSVLIRCDRWVKKYRLIVLDKVSRWNRQIFSGAGAQHAPKLAGSFFKHLWQIELHLGAAGFTFQYKVSQCCNGLSMAFPILLFCSFIRAPGCGALRWEPWGQVFVPLVGINEFAVSGCDLDHPSSCGLVQ